MSQRRAEIFLEQLQKATYSYWQIPLPSFDADSDSRRAEAFIESQFPDASRAYIEQKLQRLVNDQQRSQQVITPYEDPNWYTIMVDLSHEIEQAAKEAGLIAARRPMLGTLPTGQINAKTIRVPGTDEHIILFEWQLFLFALLLSKAVARALPLTPGEPGYINVSVDPNAIRQRIYSDPSIEARFADVVLAYAVTGKPGLAEPYFAEPLYGTLTVTLLSCMELFVMGHEYGHIVLEHLTTTPRNVRPRLNEAEEISYSWRQEYDADLIGLELMMRVAEGQRKIPANFSYSGADLFFTAIDIMDRAVSVLNGEEETARKLGSHPPNRERRWLLRRMIPRLAGKEAAEMILEYALGVQDAVDVLWELARPRLLELHRQGIRPAPWWLS